MISLEALVPFLLNVLHALALLVTCSEHGPFSFQLRGSWKGVEPREDAVQPTIFFFLRSFSLVHIGHVAFEMSRESSY